MPPALHTDTLVVPLAELPPYQEKLSEYQAKLPELKQRVGDRERDQFISGLTERLRSVSVVTSSSNPALPQRLGHQPAGGESRPRPGAHHVGGGHDDGARCGRPG